MIDHAVEDNMTIIDIGSDDGYETAYILKKYPNISKIHLVEPDTKNIDNIKLNLRKGSNQKVVLYNLAISDNDYIGDFFISQLGFNNHDINANEELISFFLQYRLSEFYAAYGDVNGDGTIDVVDLLEVVGNWGACP